MGSAHPTGNTRIQNNQHMQLSNRFEQALVFATQLHAHQTRKSGNIPYISHLLSVTALVLEDGGNEDEAIAALLHDAIEDQGGLPTREKILSLFGPSVTAIVDGCTESVTKPKPPWRDRKLKYLELMGHASNSVLRVSMADKLHNARSILAEWYREGDVVWQKFSGGKDGTLWFYRSLLQIYQRRPSPLLTPELDRVISILDQ